MASYPGSVKTFTTRNAGDTIQPSHVNDLQDEINAIESGLLNGTAPLTSSNASVQTLTVASSASFAIRPVMPRPEAVKVFAVSSQAFASSQFSTIAWGGQEYLVNSSMHSTASNPERLIPQSTGLYLVAAQLLIPSPSSGVKGVGILDSSGVAVAYQRSAVSTNSVLNVTGLKYFDALGGYVTCRFEGDGASTNSLSTGSAGSWFALTKL